VNDGRLLVLLGLAGVAGAAAVRGSRGVVRRGRGPSLEALARNVRERISAALGRLRDRDTDSVRDALRFMNFQVEASSKHDAVLPAMEDSDVRPAYRLAFPNEASRAAIEHGFSVLDSEGIHGVDLCIDELRRALGLDENFEEVE